MKVLLVLISLLGFSLESKADEYITSNYEDFSLSSMNELIAKIPASEIIRNFKVRVDVDLDSQKMVMAAVSYEYGGLKCEFSDLSLKDARCWIQESGAYPGKYELGASGYNYALKALCEALPRSWVLIHSYGEFSRVYEKPAFDGFICKKSWSASH